MTTSSSRTGATDREVAEMRERLIEFISWGETMEHGRIGDDLARQMLTIYDETMAARAAAAPPDPRRYIRVEDANRVLTEERDAHRLTMDRIASVLLVVQAMEQRPTAGNDGLVLSRWADRVRRAANPAALLAEQPGGRDLIPALAGDPTRDAHEQPGGGK